MSPSVTTPLSTLIRTSKIKILKVIISTWQRGSLAHIVAVNASISGLAQTAFVLELQLNVCKFAQLPQLQACTDSSCCGALSLHTGNIGKNYLIWPQWHTIVTKRGSKMSWVQALWRFGTVFDFTQPFCATVSGTITYKCIISKLTSIA